MGEGGAMLPLGFFSVCRRRRRDDVKSFFVGVDLDFEKLSLRCANLFQNSHFFHRVCGFEDGRAGDEHVSPCFDESGGSLAVHASIDFNQSGGVFSVNQFAKSASLVHAAFNEFLSSEARIHGHQHHQVQITNDFLQRGNRCVGIQRHARHHSFCLDLLDDTVEMDAGFIVDIHDFRAERLDFCNEFLRLHNHQMHVQRFAGVLSHCLHDGKAERDVGNEDAVHDVQMKPVAVAFVHHVEVALQIAEVGGEKGGSDEWHEV